MRYGCATAAGRFPSRWFLGSPPMSTEPSAAPAAGTAGAPAADAAGAAASVGSDARARAARRRSTLAEKLAWGAGGATQSLVNTIYALAFPIYAIGLGVSPTLIGFAKAFPRLVDAFTDPVMGNLSDNTRSRWGRRRPYVFVGSVLIALTLPLIYMPNRGWPEWGLFAWFTGTTVLFFVAYTVWSIPWSAMGLEMSDDYNDRTRLQIARMLFATVAGLGAAWAYKACFWFDADEVVGVRPVTWIIAGLMLCGGILAALFIREWRPVADQPRTALLPALRITLSNRPYLLLCGAVVFFAGGMVMTEPMLLYVNIYHVYGGDRDAASTIMGVSGSVGVVLGVAMLPVGGILSERIGKRSAALAALSLIVVGSASQYWLVTPASPYLQLASRAVFQPGIMLMWALVPSMIADVCDLDELQTGRRREASYSSVYQWIWKVGATVAMAVGGSLLALAGADVDEKTEVLPPGVVSNLRLMLGVVPALFGLIAFACVWRFPLTEATVDGIKRELGGEAPMSPS